MSSSIEDRIVRITVDNVLLEKGVQSAISTMEELKSSLNMDGASKGLKDVQDSLNNITTDSIEDELDSTSSRFQALASVAQQVMWRITGSIADAGLDLAKSITVQPLMDGLHEYETQIGSVQTILSNAGDKLKEQGYTTQEAQIEKINSSLDELNTYADKTIYNFSEMTRNIGTFTAAGVDLDTATTSIQGIANLAAASGSNATQASTAMYQLSQAIAAGSLKLQDWNSVVNAGMGGELFQNALKRTARAHGVAVDEMIEKNGSFRESLQEGWITSDILTETLQQLTMTTEGLTDAEIEEMKQSLISQGYTREEAEAILELANNAQDAATKVRTWTQLWDTVGEALGSGWAATWRIIIGDFLEATDLFTHISDGLTGLISASADARNKVLEQWSAAGGRNAMVDGIKYSFDAVLSVVKTIGQAFGDVFGISASQLVNISKAFADFAEKLVPGKEAVQFLYDAFYNVFTIIHSVLGVFGNFVRIIFNVAKAAWSIVRPFVEFGVVIAGALLSGLARLSSFLLMVSDIIESVVGVVAGAIKTAFDVVYRVIGNVISFLWNNGLSVLLTVFGALSSAVGAVVGVIADFVKALDPVGKVLNFIHGIIFKVIGFIGSFGNETKNAGDKVKGASDAATKALTPFEKLVSFFEECHSKIEKFIDGLSKADDKIGYLKTALFTAVDDIKSKVKGFFENLFSPKTLATNIARLWHFLRSSIQNLFGETEVGERALAIFDSTIGKFLTNLNHWAWNLNGFGDKFGDVLGKFKIPGIVFDTFGRLKTYFTDLFGSAKPLPEKIATLFFDIYDQISYGLTHIPEIVDKIKGVFASDFNTLKDQINSFFGEGGLKGALTNLLDNLPTPSEISDKLKGFFDSVKTQIANSFASLKEGGFSFDIGSIFTNLFSGFDGVKVDIPYLSDITSVLSGWGGALKDTIVGFFEGLPMDDIKSAIDKILSKLGEFILGRSWSVVSISFANFVSSIATLNRGIGKFGKNFGKSFQKFGESIGDGLKNFGEGFTSFKKQTKAQAFQRIAIGILILAGALWVLSKIPADRLGTIALTLGGLAAGITVMMVAVSGLDKLANLDLENIGKGIAGFGIGVLALAGAIWVLSKIPAEDVEANMKRVVGLVLLLSACLMGISATGGNLQGAAATLIAMAVAIILLMIPIEILGRTPEDVLVKGGAAVTGLLGILTGCIALMEYANKNKASIASAAPALLALAISVILLMIPVEILGRTPEDVLIKGEAATAGLAAVLAGAIALIGYVAKNAASVLAATPAMIALALSVGLMMIPVIILGGIDSGELQQGGKAVGQIAIVLGGVVAVIGLVGKSAGAILAGSVALIALAVAVGMVAAILVVLAVISSMDLSGMHTAMIAFGEIAIALIAALLVLATFGTAGAVGIVAISGALLLLSAALVALAAAIYILQNGPDWSSLGEMFGNVFGAFAESLTGLPEMINSTVSSFTDTIVNGLGGLVGTAFAKGTEIKDSIVSGFNDLKSKVMTKVTDAMNGFISSIQSKIGAAKSKAVELSNGVVNSLNSLASSMRAKASDAVNSFVGAISNGVGRARSAASSLCEAAKSGLSNLWSRFHSVGTDAVNGFIGGLTSKVGQIANAAASMVSTAINAARAKADSHSPSRVFMAIGGDTGEGYAIGITKSISTVAKATSSMAEAGIDSFNSSLHAMSFDMDDLIETDYNPVITPVIDPTSFNSDLSMLSSAMNGRFADLSIGNLNYTGELSAKISDANDLNRQTIDAISRNGIDYDRLGVSVANALIRSGLHVELDGDRFMGYLAGEIADARRQYVG